VRPGELIPGDGPTPRAEGRRGRIAVTNSGRFDAYLTSHFPLARASAALGFERAEVEGARLDLPAGASVRLPAGETTELDVTWG
jgi:urease subunit gamma/beta